MAKIGIFDSGVGGLSVLREILKVLPGEDYVYFADNANCPYGEKTKEFITERAREISGMLIGKGADIIVVACNTATAAAISALREEYSVKFIGMEPAIKPAIGMTRSGVVGVLATAGTLKAEKYRHTRELANGKVSVVEHVGQGFVEMVESGIISGPDAEDTVRASLKPLLDEGADTIVLGCTHYPFLMDTIRKIAGPDVNIIDPAPAIAKHLLEVMDDEGIRTGIHRRGNIELMASGDDGVLRRLAGMNQFALTQPSVQFSDSDTAPAPSTVPMKLPSNTPVNE